MPEIKLRFDLDKEEVELVVDGDVALTSGKDVFESWVSAYNEKHPAEPVQVEPPAPVDVEPATQTVDSTPEPVVESTESGSEVKPEDKEQNA